MIRGIFRFGFGIALAAISFASGNVSSDIPLSTPAEEQSAGREPILLKLKPERAEGAGYKLVYTVDAPPEVFWKFKTDFENRFVLSNKFIRAHRLVSRNDNAVVTEAEYTNKPKAIFRWQSTLLPDQYLLKFVLLNPQECGQKYHYGYVQLEALGSGTRVTQVAYFDFFGVSLWVNYPFYGGMSHFLKYMVQWEQQTISELKSAYE